MALILTTLFAMACGGSQTAPPAIHIAKPTPPVATPVTAALTPPKPPLKPKPIPITPRPIPPTLLSFVVEEVGPRTLTGIDYETWPSGAAYTINLPLPCDREIAVAYIHLMEDAVKQADGKWTVVKCED